MKLIYMKPCQKRSWKYFENQTKFFQPMKPGFKTKNYFLYLSTRSRFTRNGKKTHAKIWNSQPAKPVDFRSVVSQIGKPSEPTSGLKLVSVRKQQRLYCVCVQSSFVAKKIGENFTWLFSRVLKFSEKTTVKNTISFFQNSSKCTEL